jgi:hypothetical protein
MRRRGEYKKEEPNSSIPFVVVIKKVQVWE